MSIHGVHIYSLDVIIFGKCLWQISFYTVMIMINEHYYNMAIIYLHEQCDLTYYNIDSLFDRNNTHCRTIDWPCRHSLPAVHCCIDLQVVMVQ